MSRRFPAAVAVIFAHLATGILIATGLGASGLRTTPLSLMASITGNQPGFVALALIATAILAAVPFILTVPRETFVLCIAPQQVLLVLHCASAIIAISSGHYPDGYVPSGGGYFIAIDQIWLLMISLWHTLEYAQV